MVSLKPSPFLDSLYTDHLENMDNLRVRVTRYMSIEENVEARRKRSQPQIAFGGTRFSKRSQPKRFEHYTSLNTSREAVLQEACNL